MGAGEKVVKVVGYVKASIVIPAIVALLAVGEEGMYWLQGAAKVIIMMMKMIMMHYSMTFCSSCMMMMMMVMMIALSFLPPFVPFPPPLIDSC